MRARIPKHYILGLRDVKKIRKTVTYKVLIASLNIGSCNDPLMPEKITLSARDAALYIGDDPKEVYNYGNDIREDLLSGFSEDIKAVTYNDGIFTILFKAVPEKETSKDIFIETELLSKLRTSYALALYEKIKTEAQKNLSPVITLNREDLPKDGGPEVIAFDSPVRRAVRQIDENSEYEVKIERPRRDDKYTIYCKLK